LNLRVPDLPLAVSQFGEPLALTEHDTPIGPLRWWPIYIHALPGKPYRGLLVRGQKSRAPYLEIVAPVSLRSLGLSDGTQMSIQPAPPSLP